MSRLPHHLIPPVHEAVREEFNTMDVERLPAGEYHMNFRPSFALNPLDNWAVIGRLGLVAAAALLLTAPIVNFIAPRLATTDCFVAATFAGGLAVLARATGLIPLSGTATASLSLRTLATLFLFPIVLWGALALATITVTPAGALLYLGLLGLPAVAFAADHIASHTVYWMTANPTVPAEVMQACRQAWAERFGVISARRQARSVSAGYSNEGQAVVESYQNYLFGFFWGVACTVLPGVAMIFCSGGDSPAATGFEAITAIALSVIVVSVLQTIHQPRSFRRYWRALVHYLRFSPTSEQPNWVFSSPCGSASRRQVVVAIAVFLLGLGIVATADYFTYLITCPVSARLIPTDVIAAFADRGYSRFPVAIGAALAGESYLGFCFLVALTACVILPVLVFVLAVFIVIGPAVSAHHAALEE